MATLSTSTGASLRSWCRPRRRPDRKSCCVETEPPPERPDPATYSQLERLSLGQLPTWNSPDLLTHDIPTYTLMKEPEVRVRNLSTTASAVNVQVHLSTAPFGIGTQKTALSTRVIGLAPSQELTLLYPLPQALLAGDPRIGFHVVIDHPHDRNRINSRGSQTIVIVRTSEVGRSFQEHFPVVNLSSAPRLLTLSVLPNELGATVSPASRNFAPFEQFQATLNVQVPDSLHGSASSVLSKEVTIIGRGPDGAVIDGVTFIVRLNN